MEYIETILRYVCHTSEALSWKEIETKLVQVIEEERKGDIMTIAEELKREGRIEGEIKTYRELMDNGLIPKYVAEKKIAEFSEKLESVTVGAHIVPAGGSDVPDQILA